MGHSIMIRKLEFSAVPHFLIILLFIAVRQSATAIRREMSELIKSNANYTLLTENMDLVTYVFISKKATQVEALHECMNLYNGRLLTIINGVQDNAISQLLTESGVSDDIITAGKFNMFTQRWEWSTNAATFGYDNWTHPPDVTNQPDHCCFKTGRSNNAFRWISKPCTENKGFFFCEVLI